MKKVLVTGATGTIGTIVREDLSGKYDFTLLSRRRIDEPGFVQIDVASEYDRLESLVHAADVVLHLAYVEEDETTTVNLQMAKNIYSAALRAEEPPRLVMASSVHAVAGHIDWSRYPYSLIAEGATDIPPDLISPITTGHRRRPNGVYGVMKCYVELLGQFYAGLGLDVVCIRFGGVRLDDSLPDEPGYHAFWLSRSDCAALVERAVEAELRQHFNLVFGVSGNSCGVYDLSDARELLGFEPSDDSARLLRKPRGSE